MSWVGRGEGRGENLGEFFAFTILSQIRPPYRQFRQMIVDEDDGESRFIQF